MKKISNSKTNNERWTQEETDLLVSLVEELKKEKNIENPTRARIFDPFWTEVSNQKNEKDSNKIPRNFTQCRNKYLHKQSKIEDKKNEQKRKPFIGLMILHKSSDQTSIDGINQKNSIKPTESLKNNYNESDNHTHQTKKQKITHTAINTNDLLNNLNKKNKNGANDVRYFEHGNEKNKNNIRSKKTEECLDKKILGNTLPLPHGAIVNIGSSQTATNSLNSPVLTARDIGITEDEAKLVQEILNFS